MKHLKIAALIAATTLSTTHADDSILGPILMQLQLMQSGQSPERTQEELERLGRGSPSRVEQAALEVAINRTTRANDQPGSMRSLARAVGESNPILGDLLEDLATRMTDGQATLSQMETLNGIIANPDTPDAQREGALQESWQLLRNLQDSATSSERVIHDFFENEDLTDEQREEAQTLIELVTGHRPE